MSRIMRYIPLVAWMAFIFFWSSRPEAGHDEFYWWLFIIRKSAHVFEFFTLTLIAFATFDFKRLDLALILSLLYAFSDELHQLFVPGRTGTLTDVGVDSLGILLAVIVIKYTPWRRLSLIQKLRRLI